VRLIFNRANDRVLNSFLRRAVSGSAGYGIERSGRLKVQLTRHTGHGDGGADAGFQFGGRVEPGHDPLLLERLAKGTIWSAFLGARASVVSNPSINCGGQAPLSSSRNAMIGNWRSFARRYS
jgi:hypothetical protein